METRIIMQDLRTMGVGCRYMGYNQVIKAVRMASLDQSRLQSVKQGILQPLAEDESCDWRAVERNIRTVIHRAWNINRPYLSGLAGYPMNQEPTVSEFVEILSTHATSRHLS